VDRFDHVLLDQWGTLHEGKTIFPAARECVARLREAGKRVLVLSNSGKRANRNQERLATLGLSPEAYDGILSSGEVTWSGLHARAHQPFTGLGRACFLITRDGDRSIVEALERLGNPDPRRILVIGDSLDHDIAGGRAAAMLTLLVSSGAHRETLADAAELPAIRAAAGSEARMPHWTMKHPSW